MEIQVSTDLAVKGWAGEELSRSRVVLTSKFEHSFPTVEYTLSEFSARLPKLIT